MANEKKVVRDEAVLEVQQWLNATYGSVAGWVELSEDGATGWGTVYGLLHGLQHELGLQMVDNFGPGTTSEFDKIADQIKTNEVSTNIIKIIQGAFYAKGIEPGGLTGTYSATTQAALESLQTDAGFTPPSGNWGSVWMKPLCDMSQFTLVPDGKANVREMQQHLNVNYWRYFGIKPCDGIYQRDTNTALIYALQATVGMAVGEANGIYGPQTIAKCPTLTEGMTNSEQVRILQYGLMVNGYDGVKVNNNYTEDTTDYVFAFNKMMNLVPDAGNISSNRVIKGLLTSNGDTDRESIACDTSRQLTAANVADLKSNGYSIVGRYLTGTVGSGASEVAKHLTAAEIERITKGGLSIFPIYQDGGATSGYFTNMQGYLDAMTAQSAARGLGFLEGTTIYFACDVDLLEGDIEGTIVAYMKGVNTAFNDMGSNFKIGVYGTRNVCTHVINNDLAAHCFVSNMSTGYSGNLGYPMAPSWSFDQYWETTLNGLPIDKVNTDLTKSDQGCAVFTPGELTENDKRLAVLNMFPDNSTPNLFEFEWGKEYTITATPMFELTWSAQEEVGDGGVVSIKDGEIDSVSLTALLKKLGLSTDNWDLAISTMGLSSLGSSVSEGKFTISTNFLTNKDIEVSIELDIMELEAYKGLKANITTGITLTIHSGFWIDLGMELVTETEQVVAAVLTAAKLVVEIVIGVGIAVFIAGLLVWLGPAFAVFAV